MPFSSIGQSTASFDIKEIIITDTLLMKDINDFVKNDTAFFQDEDYYVRRICSGEWGGSIWFKNKKTGIEYSSSATCPVIVNKIGGKYYVTSTLAHICGFSEVLKINHPDSMEIFQLPKPRYKKGKKYYRYVGDDESKSKKGTELLVDTICARILISFPFDNQLYHIVSDNKMTYLGKIENKKLAKIDTIIHDNLENFRIKSQGVIHNFRTEAFLTNDNHYVVLFINNRLLGYLDIFGNRIRFIRYK